MSHKLSSIGQLFLAIIPGVAIGFAAFLDVVRVV